MRLQISRARELQAKRYGAQHLNADMTNADIRKWSRLTDEAKQLLDTAAVRLSLSARAYMRAVKVSRTIADLEQSEAVTVAHISEALAYRSQPIES